ncbi:tetratricopeptide repeat protein [Peredibacter sp. HCB2-198]|uniref:tetratricopeptide repeat protein n=1 Tax=Peredibacter sp. HCB2-198 TaxID=3383025 RepID=UPI0038B55D54
MFKAISSKSTGIVFLCLFVLASCASKQTKLQQKQAEIYFGAGTQSLMDRQYTEALKNLIKANELNPDNTEILNNLGMAYYFKGEKDLAVKTLNAALEASDRNSDARVNLASIFYKDGEVEKAETIYKQVLKDLTYDKQARTYYNLGIIELQNRRNIVGAENYFKKAIKEDDNYCPAYYQLGLVQYQRRQFNSALTNFKEASMGTCYDLPAPHYYQALTLIELRRYDEARIKLDDVDTRFPKTTFAVKARSKAIELNEIESRNKSTEAHASRKVLESPDF